MKNEYWATFSIYDHRTALYHQALVLFDRIVVPVPTRTVGSLSLATAILYRADEFQTMDGLQRGGQPAGAPSHTSGNVGAYKLKVIHPRSHTVGSHLRK